MPFNKIRITGYRVCIPYIQVFHFVCGAICLQVEVFSLGCGAICFQVEVFSLGCGAICLQVEVFSVGPKVMLGVFWG